MNGAVGLRVEANRSFSQRIGTVAIAGRSFSVTQEALPNVDSPTLRITLPNTPTVNTTAGSLNVAGTAADNFQVSSVAWRTDRGLSGVAAGTTSWTIAGLPLLAGRNVITVTAVDPAGNVSNAATLIINSLPASVLTTVAGSGVVGFDRDNVQAVAAALTRPWRINFDSTGNLYIADDAGNRVRRVAPNGVITTVAGTGVAGFSGDGTAPTGINLSFPTGIAFDATGNLIIADSSNNRVRRVRPAAALRTLANVSAASFSPTAGLAAEEIAAAFGQNLASTLASTTALPLPTALAGTTVNVRDSLGVERLAPLFFVSTGQVNYLVPSGTANGIATVTITNAAGEIATGTVTIANVAPGLFAVNSSGMGLAAALVFRVTAGGQTSFEPVVRFDAAPNGFVAVPIDLGPAGDQVFLIPFGSGFRGHSGLANLSATIGGVHAPVSFAGAVPGLVGADQANLRIDRSLAGRGEVEVVLTVDGKVTNAVRVAIR